VLLAVLWRLRHKLGFRDVAELLLERGYEVTHETIRGWEARFAPLLAERLRARRRQRGPASRPWYMDESYVKVAGRWCYLYRAIDGDGQLLDSMLSEHRDKHAARRFLRRLVDVAGGKPLRVTTDKHPAYRKAIRWILGRKVEHRTTQYLNNFMEQDHRAVKQRYYPMRGFGSFVSASRFCSAFDELRQYFRWRRRRGDSMPLAEQRRLFTTRWRAVGHQYPDRCDCPRFPTLALDQADGARVVRATGSVVATLVLGRLHLWGTKTPSDASDSGSKRAARNNGTPQVPIALRYAG